MQEKKERVKKMPRIGQTEITFDSNAALFCTPGAVREADGIRFSLAVPTGMPASLALFDRGSGELVCEEPFSDEAAAGELRTLLARGLLWEKAAYAFRVGDAWATDPYARRVTVCEGEGEGPRVRFLPDFSPYDWQGDKPPGIPYERAVMYHLHVRNFTRHPKSKVRHKGTFLGLKEKIPYLAELGVNQVKLMPIYEPFPRAQGAQETLSAKMPAPSVADVPGKRNVWGYGPGLYFAPRREFAATDDPVRECKDLVRAMHAAGIEVILELFFTADLGARLMLDCMAYWVEVFHVDGFHIMGNEAIGGLLRGDPILSRTKILLTSVPGGQKAGAARTFAECNDGFLADMRQFLKGDEGMLGAFAERVRRNPANFGVVNYLTNHDGFTLNDLVSYDNKHNEENGEQNMDGAACNFSWNCGVEGMTRKKSVLELRKKQMRNAFLLMLLSHGTPMLLAGDEFANSQGGNNNPYCLDNATSWVDWGAYAKHVDLAEFVRRAIAFRKAHGMFQRREECRLSDYRSCGYPDMSFHSDRAWYGGFAYNSRQLGVMYCGAYANEEEFLYVAYNLHPLAQELAIPALPAGMDWHVAIDTSAPTGFLPEGQARVEGRTHTFPARSITVLVGKRALRSDQSG